MSLPAGHLGSGTGGLMLRAILLLALGTALLGGCSTTRETSPNRTATEQLLISAAADRAAEQLTLEIPPGSTVYVDSTYFDVPDGRYAIAAVRERLLKLGAALSQDRNSADLIVEIRAGALSIDENEFIVGFPGAALPLPLSGPLQIPEVPLFKRDQRLGIAKIAATAYDRETGKLVDATGSQYGFSDRTEWVVLLLFSWTTSDITPGLEEEEAPDAVGRELPFSLRRHE